MESRGRRPTWNRNKKINKKTEGGGGGGGGRVEKGEKKKNAGRRVEGVRKGREKTIASPGTTSSRGRERHHRGTLASATPRRKSVIFYHRASEAKRETVGKENKKKTKKEREKKINKEEDENKELGIRW